MLEKFLIWWQQLVIQLQQASLWYQLAAIAGCLLLAVLVNRLVGQRLRDSGGQGLRHMALRSSDRILLPFSLATLLAISSGMFAQYQLSQNLLQLFIPIALALGVIRLLVYILRKAFLSSPLVKSAEPVIAITIWLLVVLHLADWLTPLMQLMDALAFTLGESRISLLGAVKLTLVIVLAFTLALWLAELLNQQLKKAKHVSPSMQVGFSKFSKFLLITIAFLIALNAVGINLSSLAVFGGALGVGLGFGLQRIASNFISGFILVLDRSVKPGDVISVGDNFGWVHELKARYVVVRNREGVDTLIPNENLITSEVINWSYEDRNVRVKILVQVSYDDDPEQAMALMLQCANKSSRVLNEPAPTVMLKSFADNGIELELRVWIADPEYGADTVKSDINVAIWRAFKQAAITIPYPQRDLHVKSGTLPTASE
ncbi:mechanosensitive ion channel family protein [Rheinheimera maricola]|uniref:Mechanosensitive ion channel n=1 Tax=Rheinheimera maricola TaxID=2793282 RepID=A0ABS7X3G7_9GAMM|nr:mechanosensitive ion channel domain-containing protein [Rheinheimera maricola]MBZ9610103.1 mechanosensitive ion channel [Rheinheimera maricola]